MTDNKYEKWNAETHGKRLWELIEAGPAHFTEDSMHDNERLKGNLAHLQKEHGFPNVHPQHYPNNYRNTVAKFGGGPGDRVKPAEAKAKSGGNATATPAVANAPMYSVMLTDAYAFGSGGTGQMVDVHVLMFGGTATSDFKMEVCPGGESMEISWAWPKCLLDEDFKSNIGKSSDSCVVAFKRGLKTFLEKHPNGMFRTTVSLAPHKVIFPQTFDIRMVKFLDDEDSTQGQVAIVKLIIKNEESTIERTAEVYSAPKKRKSFTSVAATAAGTDGRNRSSDRGGDTSDN